jgi:hypothetical protein
MTDQSVDATDMIPNPGSDAAIALGCTCPVLDNGHGRGYMGQKGIYIYNLACPVHKASWPKEKPHA